MLGMVWAVFKWMFIIILWPVSLSVWFYRTPRFQLEPKRRALVLVCVWGGLLILGGILKLIQ